MSKLVNYINSLDGQVFKWGQHDCCVFAANALIAIGKPDYMDFLRGYRNELGAFTLLQRVCGTTNLREVMQIVAERKGLTSVNLDELQEGDVIVAKTTIDRTKYFKDNHSLGIYAGGKAWTTYVKGVDSVLDSEIVEAWRAE